MTKATYKKIYIGTLIALIVIVAVVIVLYVTGARLQSPVVFLSPSQRVVNNKAVQPEQELKTNDAINSLQNISGGTATQQMSYDQAAQLYKFSHLTFDPNCRVTPVTLVVPPQTVIMLDNQSKWQRSIIVGPDTYTLPPYTYILASLNTSGAYGISCDSINDVGFVSVQ